MIENMIKHILICFVAAAGLSPCWAFGDFPTARFEKIIKHSRLKTSDLGVVVTDASGRELFSLNGEKKFIPASITKLMTTAAVMDALQPDYKLETDLLADAKPDSQGILNGSIYFRGGGDPAFVSEKLWVLVDDFIRSRIKQIHGDLVVDDSYFDDERFDPGREKDRNDRAYDAPLGALSINWNSITIAVRPGKAVGDPAQVYLDPENDYVHLVSHASTSEKGTDLKVSREKDGEKDVIVVAGHIATGAPEKLIYKNITDPALYAGYCLKQFLAERGVLVTGHVIRGKTAATAQVVAKVESAPLSEMIIDMNKFSNNFVAETLAKILGAYATKGQGHMADGIKAIHTFLESKVGFTPGSYSLVNVSGFTRKNQFTPRQFTRLLSWLTGQFRIFPEILSSLPVAGVDGTLEKRMRMSPAQRWVRAKTGMLNEVVSLAGFAGRIDESPLIFAFMYNGPADEGHVRDTFDSLAESLVQVR